MAREKVAKLEEKKDPTKKGKNGKKAAPAPLPIKKGKTAPVLGKKKNKD